MNVPNHIAIIWMETDAGQKQKECREITVMHRDVRM